MPYLLRVSLPDVPGSLGRLASAVGAVGADIEAIEIVEKSVGRAVDDVLLEVAPGTMPDSVVSAVSSLEGVEVLWISRYAAGGNVFMDLEAVEAITAEPAFAVERLIDLIPVTFRADWAAQVTRNETGALHLVRITEAGSEDLSQLPEEIFDAPARMASHDGVTLLCSTLLPDGSVVVTGRRGGPAFLESEVARIGHVVSLAGAIQQY